jgi:Cu2+-exporting ATPase
MSTVTAHAESPMRRVGCAHCGLPAPPPAVDAQLSFCCRGCQGAYELIRGWGLEEFYDLRDCPSSESKVDDSSSTAYSDLDDPSLLGRSAPFPVDCEGGHKRFRSRLSLSGLHCVACVWLIERACERVDGWQSSTVNMHARSVDIVFDPEVIRLSRIAGILHQIGYRVAPLSDEEETDNRMDDQQRMLVDIAVAGFCAANAMWVAIALYAGQFSGIAAGHAQILRVAGVLLGGLAVVFPGRVFFRSAWASWTTRTPHMDLPVAVGLSAGMAASLYGLFDSTSDVYFDSIACLVLFLLVGRWIQMRQQRRAGQAVSDLIRLSPTVASRVEPDDQIKRVRADTLAIGDRVRINPGESIPVDGIVEDGESSVDRSLLTGESRPVAVSPGSVVEAGTENLQAVLTVRATAAAADTRFAAISRAVAEAAQSRTPIVQFANRVGGWFVVVVLVLAAITAVVWWVRDPTRITSSVVSLLIVACPCALALATPLALAVAIGRLARHCVLIREGDCLERIAKPGTIFFDKTGTLTEGRMRVTEWSGDREPLSAVAAIEKSINHPIAKAVCQCADQHHAELRDAVEVHQTVGQGVSGIVQGAQYVIGGTRVARDRGLDVSQHWQQPIERIRGTGASPIVVIREDQIVAVFGVTDPIRSRAADVVQYYRSRGWRIGIVSGDDQRTVDHVARQLDIDLELARGELLPDEKLQAIEAVSGDQPVVMVGDGVNDAAALAAADVGIAISGGAAASLSAAPVMIGDGNLEKVIMLADAASRTRRGIRQNFAISIGYNVIAVILAMMGIITPLLAALLMPVSSVTVLALTLARPTFGETKS